MISVSCSRCQRFSMEYGRYGVCPSCGHNRSKWARLGDFLGSALIVTLMVLALLYAWGILGR